MPKLFRAKIILLMFCQKWSWLGQAVHLNESLEQNDCINDSLWLRAVWQMSLANGSGGTLELNPGILYTK